MPRQRRAARKERPPVELAPIGISTTEKGAVRLRFDVKPSDEIREALKNAGFRWNRRRLCWIHKATPEHLALAESLAEAVN